MGRSAPRNIMMFLFFLVLFSPMAIDIYLPALPVMAAEFQVPEVRVQDTVTWFMLSFGLGQLVVGPLADRYGRRPIALFGIALFAVSSYLAVMVTDLNMLLVARLIQGIAASATSVAAFACVRDSFGAEKSGKMISYLNGVICFIPALAPILGSYLTIHLGWRSNFTFMALFALLGLVYIGWGFPETKPENEKSPSLSTMFSWQRYLSVLRNGQFLFNALQCLLAMAVILAYVTSAPMWLINHLGLSMEAFTGWFSVNAVFNILGGLLVAPMLMDRFGTRFALQVGMTLVIVGGILLLQGGTTPLAFMLPLFINAIGFAIILGACSGKALAPFGDKAGTAAALLGLLQMTGAGALVGMTQRLNLDAPSLLTFHMFLLIPGFLMLMMKLGRRWHPVHNS
ncbi:multidrug effflux MFS transporter [Thaumasiovibrio subtropicus]|uniref:multidrug effflux MFS transporter n=1 Tax=Thaumasiovibrio subtropicus TaxID=1891207 RepID=UPI000B360034|nr:multidrug effflux MFS transporter [Thaumasiovibrio subtropicus]